MSNDYYRGYAAGRMAVQPEWIRAKDQLPTRDGHYYTIKEALKGAPGIPIGAVAIDTSEVWYRGKWQQNDKYWKVIFWAKPVEMEIPRELMKRYRIGA